MVARVSEPEVKGKATAKKVFKNLIISPKNKDRSITKDINSYESSKNSKVVAGESLISKPPTGLNQTKIGNLPISDASNAPLTNRRDPSKSVYV